MTKKFNRTKIICLCFLAIGFLYGMILPFCWNNNPFDPLGTLSILCESRKIYFWLWVLLDGGALFVNIFYMYKKFGNAGKLIKALPVISMICAALIALTLGHSIADWNPKRIVHWVATGGYVLFLALSVGLYALVNLIKTKEKIFAYMLAGVFAILLLFLVWFIVFGKSGMLEIVPHALLQIFLLVVNYIIKPKKAETLAQEIH